MTVFVQHSVYWSQSTMVSASTSGSPHSTWQNVWYKHHWGPIYFWRELDWCGYSISHVHWQSRELVYNTTHRNYFLIEKKNRGKKEQGWMHHLGSRMQVLRNNFNQSNKKGKTASVRIVQLLHKKIPFFFQLTLYWTKKH